MKSKLKRKIVFLTGTRADFGKMKKLMHKVDASDNFVAYIFVTGMHMLSKYGSTYHEVEKCNFKNIHKYSNQGDNTKMDIILSKTIVGFSKFIDEYKPDLIVIHGDRLEALAGATVGAFNNVLVAHIEGGEVSGTVDEILRHSITKLSHLHFVSNNNAKQRVLQLGENKESTFVIGSPDIDIMKSQELPKIEEVKKHYNITFNNYNILIFHPVTTETKDINEQIEVIISALVESKKNYIVIYPNNDHGSSIILNEYKTLRSNKRFKSFPSVRFEYYLMLLKEADLIIGNSSSGIREAMVYGIPSINIGSRQSNRLRNVTANNVFNVEADKIKILDAIQRSSTMKFKSNFHFGNGNSADLFFDIISKESTWEIKVQKEFNDLNIIK